MCVETDMAEHRNPSVFFFFSSRRRHTRFDCDWSSDVCSSDLLTGEVEDVELDELQGVHGLRALRVTIDLRNPRIDRRVRSEERRVGKECRSRWSPYH